MARIRLQKKGWRVLVIWECETRVPQHLPDVITRFLESYREKQGTED